ncbi:MAG: deoxyribose-phosphate aldolase [bacterium]
MNSQTITRKELAALFDHSQLKAFATDADFKKLCDEARMLNCAMVAINSVPVALCKSYLKDTDIHVGAAISFPLGQTTIANKLSEALGAIEDGADEIDYVINIGQAKMHHYAYIREEMEAMVALCRKHQVIIKVIFENCYLTKEEIKEIALIARDVEPDFIKTSTGFGTGGALVEDVKLMKETVGDKVQVKAAGGIRSWESCAALIDAGATRIGTSSSFAILEGFDAAH